MLKRFAIIAALCLAAVSELPGRVIEIRKKAEVNPTIRCGAIPGDPALERELRNILGVCGWFDPAPAGKPADYELTFAPGIVRLNRGNGDKRILSWINR